MQQIGFYCKTYCSLNMFRAPLCPSSGAQDLYRWLLLDEQHPANRTYNPQLHTRPTTCKPKRQVPQAATICIILELLMMGIVVPETCWADNMFCNKNQSVASSWPFITTYVLTMMHGQTHVNLTHVLTSNVHVYIVKHYPSSYLMLVF